jgi:uncharacterized membrane-anchored protein
VVEAKRKLAALEATLKYEHGEVPLGDGLAKLNITPEFRFLGPSDAQKVLQAWGNPPGDAPLGMIFPASVGPFDEESWGVIVSYDEDGHIDDAESQNMDFAKLLKQMQDDTKEHNAERKKEGYAPVQLVGWAEPPHYDGATKKLYWAKELDFGEGDHTLNYAIRVLGRKGVLQLNAVASLSQLGSVKSSMQQVLGLVEFKAGHRYVDFDPKVDKVAAFGLGALIADGVAAKAKLFKGLIALLIADKKLVILGIAALGAGLKKFFDDKNKQA